MSRTLRGFRLKAATIAVAWSARLRSPRKHKRRAFSVLSCAPDMDGASRQP